MKVGKTKKLDIKRFFKFYYFEAQNSLYFFEFLEIFIFSFYQFLVININFIFYYYKARNTFFLTLNLANFLNLIHQFLELKNFL